MSFWNTVKSDLKKAVEEGWAAVKDGAKVAAEKSEEVAKTGKLKYRAHILHKDAEKLFADLGGVVYDLAKGRSEKNPLLKPEVKRLLEEIKQLEENASVMEDDITNIKKHRAKGSPRASQNPKATREKGSVAGNDPAPKKVIKKKTRTTVKKKAARKPVKKAASKKTVKKKAPAKAAPKKIVKKKAASAKKPVSKKKA